MKILNNPIDSFKYDDVVNFCLENNRENVQLDYKENLTTGSLSKHFAAFSNTRGGVIIIGVKEDKHTGLPLTYEGIDINAQDIEKITQWANNIEPLPKYKIHPTDSKNNKRFILIRIYEGDDTPYYIQNNGSLWIRTENISKELFEIASPDYSKLLNGKRNNSENARSYYLSRAHDVLVANLQIATRKINIKKEEAINSTDRHLQHFGNAKGLLTVHIQPNYPFEPLTKPNNLIDQLREYRFTGHSYNLFPSDYLSPIPEGAASFNDDINNVEYICNQVYTQGLLYLRESILDNKEGKKVIFMDYILGKIFVIFKAAQKFYKFFGYQGTLKGLVNLFKVKDIQLFPSSRGFMLEDKQVLLDSYDWDIIIDTNILLDEGQIIKYFIKLSESIFWDLGLRSFDENQILRYLKETRLTPPLKE